MKITGQQPPEFHSVKGGTGKDNQKIADSSGRTQVTAEPPVKTSTFVMNEIKGRILAEPEVREDRVAELKAKIRSGEYQVDSQRLAKTMLEDALEEGMI